MAEQYVTYVPTDFAPTTSFYIFDLDGTIAISKSGKLFASDTDDTFIIPSVPQLFTNLHTAGHTVLIVTNQAYWTPQIKQKIEYIFNTLNVPILVATGLRSHYRKPSSLLWQTFKIVEKLQPTEIRMVGDAVGPSDPYPPYRWASSDADFAKNIRATFIRPCDIIASSEEPVLPEGLSVIVMVGNPGSGKSSMGARIAEKTNALHIEQDKYSSRSKVLGAARVSLQEGRSIILDATHSNKERREEAYAIAEKYNATPHIIWLTRDGRPFNALREKPIPAAAYGIYTKYFSDPREDGVSISVIY